MLEEYIAGDGMAGQGHGAHGHAVHEEEHEEENPHLDKIKKMSPYEFLEYIKGLHTKDHDHYIEDLDKRAGEIHKIHEAYHDEEVKGRITNQLLKEFKKVKLKHKKYQDLHDKVKDAYKANDKEPLPHHQMEEHLKEYVNQIFTDLGYGLDNKEQNYTTFRAYLEQLSHTEEGKKAAVEIFDHMKKGKGKYAAKKIVDLLKVHKQIIYDNNVLSAIVTEDTPEFHAAYANIIKEKTEEEVPGESVLEGLIAKDIKKTAGLAAKGEYEAIAQEYKPRHKKPTEHGHGEHAAPAHH